MTDQTLVKPEREDAAARCGRCGSIDHTTDYHDNTPTDYHDNGVPDESDEK